MSGMLNIGGDPMDRSYRYKMPKLVAKVEGRGNGIKTRIVNCGEIAAALHRKPAVLTKFFGCELGAQSRWEDKEEASIVNGAFEANVMQDKLNNSFLPKFVLCPNCGLPETSMKVKKEVVKFECAACGYAGDADMGHKLITFILADNKKEKDAKKAAEKGDKKKDKKDKESGDKEEDKKEKKKDKKDKDGEKKPKDKEKKKKKEKKEKKEESDEEEWSVDVSPEAVEARRLAEMAKMGANAQGMVDTVDVPAVEEVAEAVSAVSLDDSADALLESLMGHIGESKKSKEVLSAATAWMDDLEVPKDKAPLFAMLEKLPENAMKHSNAILKVLYDHDAISAADLFAWHESANGDNQAVTNAQAFVDFLKADDDDE